MRVLLDTTFARRGPSGTGIYIERLVPALRALGIEVVEAANERRRPPAGGGLGSWRNAAEDRRWSAVELPRRAREAEASVIHHALPAAAARAGLPQVITLHDLAFERLPGAFDPRFRVFARRAHRAAALRAEAVVCVSRTTATDAVALWGVAPERIVVAPHGPGQEPAPRPDPPAAERHLLYVGDSEPRKNLDLLLAAYARFRAAAVGGSAEPPPLVLAGAARVAAEGVRVEASPDSARLAELYAEAIALVHPALHEGFGLTALEAMSAGVPVLAGRSPGIVETCAEAAAYFDPRDPSDLAAALARVVGDESERRDLGRRGRERAAAFSWERSARAHVEAYTLAAKR